MSPPVISVFKYTQPSKSNVNNKMAKTTPKTNATTLYNAFDEEIYAK